MLQITGFGDYWFAPFWYVSALLFASLVIYYLAIKNRERFTLFYAPLAIVLIYSWFWQTRGCLAGIGLSTNTLLVCDGFWRAFAGMCVGCLAHELKPVVDNFVKQIIPQGSLRSIAYTICEAFILIGLFVNFYGQGCTKRDFILVLGMAFLIIFVFIGESYLTQIFNNSLSYKLGVISYAMYCNHMIINNLIRAFFPGYNFLSMIVVYLLLVIILSFATDKICTLIVKKNKKTVVK